MADEITQLLGNTMRKVPYARFVLLANADGLLRAQAGADDLEHAEKFAAVLSSRIGLSLAAGELLTGQRKVSQSLDEYDGVVLLSLPAGSGALVAMALGSQGDASLASYELSRLVKAMHEHLAAVERAQADVPARPPR